MAWSIEQVVAIAPSPARFAAADAIAAPSRWVALGADDGAAWGRCRGTGREPYETTVDHAHLAWRCSCPSRSHPCKHALALLIMWVRGQVPDAAAPASIRSWVDGHARHEPVPAGPAGAQPAAVPPDDEPHEPPPDAAPDLERQRDERIARLQAGLVELDRWLDDRVRTGLADPALARYSTWDDLVARLVDARAGALANRVRRLAGVVGARPDWHEVVLAELGILHLLAVGGQRVPDLPDRLADSVATACGWQVRQADVVAGVPDTDTWVVAGRSDTREDRIEVRRTWLRGQSSGAWAMVLSFAAFRQSLDDSLVVGDAFTADLHRYPGPSWRSIVGTRHAAGVTHPVAPPLLDVAGACAEVGAALAGEPWLDRVPTSLVATPTLDRGRWVLTDHTGSVAVAPEASGLATLLAASAGRPVAVTVEWTIDGAVPLTIHLADRALDIGPRADASFVSAGVTATASLTEHWHELVTVALLGTDRRDPPDAPLGALADVVDDAVGATPSARMLTAVGGCVAARRAGLRPLAPAPPLAPPEADDRPLVPTRAARRWSSIIVEWPVLEDEWLAVAERAGWQLPPDVLVGLLRRHRTDAARRARVLRMGGGVAAWVLEHQPSLRSSAGRRELPPGIDDPLPGLAVPPELLALLTAGPGEVVPAVVGRFRDGTFGTTHRAVLVNFMARMRTDALLPLASALAADELPYAVAGLAHSLAALASTRFHLLEELTTR